jgi:hypothetical protein
VIDKYFYHGIINFNGCMEPLFRFRNRIQFVLIGARVFFPQLKPGIYGMGDILDGMSVPFFVLKIKGTKIYGVKGAVIQTVKGQPHKALTLQVLSPDITFDGAVGKQWFLDPEQTIARLRVQVYRTVLFNIQVPVMQYPESRILYSGKVRDRYRALGQNGGGNAHDEGQNCKFLGFHDKLYFD